MRRGGSNGVRHRQCEKSGTRDARPRFQDDREEQVDAWGRLPSAALPSAPARLRFGGEEAAVGVGTGGAAAVQCAASCVDGMRWYAAVCRPRRAVLRCGRRASAVSGSFNCPVQTISILKCMSMAPAPAVMPLVETTSTPVSAIRRMLSRRTPPDASSRARPSAV